MRYLIDCFADPRVAWLVLLAGIICLFSSFAAIAIGARVAAAHIDRRVADQIGNHREAFPMLFDCNPIPMFVYETQALRFLAVNDAALARFGYSRERFLTMSVFDFKPHDQWGELRKAMETGTDADTTGGIWHHVRSDGIEIEVTIHARSLVYEGNSARLAAVTNINERHCVEGDLARTQTFLDNVINHVSTPITVKNAHDLKYTLVNRAAEEFFGIPREQMIGRTASELFSKEVADIIADHDRRLIEARRPLLFDEHTFVMADKRSRAVLSSRTPIFNERGVLQYLVTAVDDITERKKAEAELHRTRAFLDTVIESLPIMVTVKTASDQSYVLVNRASEGIFKVPAAQMIGKRVHDFVAPEEAAIFEARDRDVLNGRKLVSFEHKIIDFDTGAVSWVNATKAPILGDDGEPQYLVTLSEDITARRRAEAERDRSQEFLHTILENVPVPILVKDANELRFVLVNRACEEFWGVGRGEMIGKTSHDFFRKKEADLIVLQDKELLHSDQPLFEERQIHTPHNGIRSIISRKLVVRGADGKPQYLIGVTEDVTERKRTEERIALLARHDTVTGIANRTVLREKLEEAAARSRSDRERFTVLILDLDEFKYVNDTLGHGAGDQLLKELALRLQSSLDETGTVARLGGDEFAIIQAGETNQRERAIALAIKLLDIVARPFDIDGHNVIVRTSIGIALAPENGTEPGELLKRADLALYRAKSDGRNGFSFFDEEMSKDATARHRLLNDLRAALSRNEFELHYQPLVDAKTVRPCGAEALVRWRHPVDGLIFPDRFIWLAEESGLIEPLGEWILERACADAASWPENIKVAVNLSAAQFRSGRLFDVILCALVESGLPPERLELEITESLLLQKKESYGVMIRQLKNIGISIVLDDFGTGYSSLSYLTRFPFDKIKIDKSFTQGLSNRADCAAVVASVLTLARGLDMAVTAEGVETKQQFELLRAAGVKQVQGYLFGRPRPVAQLDFSALEREARAVEAA
jgi:diguanylate cyclase (GGDEF)-like protein/PAS domain S-box-containing protein